MQFPLYIPIGPLAFHPHWVFEALAYLVGARLYVWLKARTGDPIAADDRWTVIAAAALGAGIGDKLLFWASEPWFALDHVRDPLVLLGGKSIVGALAGGLLAVELVKRRAGINRSTGDVFAIPLAVGIGIGRIGCFLTGLDDHTHGLPAALPWAVDYGDGILRHPAQLYEVGFVWLLAVVLALVARRPHREGDVFRLFMCAYMIFRFGLEFLKPGLAFGGLNAIQWVCIAVLAYYASVGLRNADFRFRIGARRDPLPLDGGGSGWG